VINYLPSEQPDVDELVKSLGDKASNLIYLPGDLSDEQFAKKLVSDAAKKLGGLDILVNNAGKQVSVEDVRDIKTEQLEQTFRVNVFALVWTVQAALEYLPKGGTIINTTSIQAIPAVTR
jgi:NAD(P)-dependent dehydrogenase (short-subunit alcohol dehydrogenase family)